MSASSEPNTSPSDPEWTGGRVYAQSDDFWTKYLKGRPVAPDSYLERIYRYHHEHGGEFDAIHDCGAGVAPHAHRLAARFAHVLISDINPSNTALVQARLTDTTKYSFASGAAETIDIPASSMDCVFAMTMMHFVDGPQAMQAFATQLRPGGTLAFGFYGFYRFRDATVQQKWDELFKAAMIHSWGTPDGSQQPQMLAALKIEDSGYHAVEVPAALFKDVRRFRLNWYGDETSGRLFRHLALPLENKVGADDVCLEEEDPAWHFEIDMQGVRDNFYTFPFIPSDQYEPLLGEMEKLVGSRVLSVYCPVSLVLATRR